MWWRQVRPTLSVCTLCRRRLLLSSNAVTNYSTPPTFVSPTPTPTSSNGRDKIIQSQVQLISKDQGHKLYNLVKDIIRLQQDAGDMRALSQEAEKDKEFQKMVEKDLVSLEQQIEHLNNIFIIDLVDSYRFSPIYANCTELLLEVSAGVGGQEAMLFSRELLDMYSNYVSFKNWTSAVVHEEQTELGGLRHGSILITSPDAYKRLSLEAGVHRVQRIPKTEKSGRIHTSTSTVSILPTVDNIDIKIDDKDLKIETKRASGAGGQHVNKTESAVRISHLPTGIAVECQTERSQIRNRTIAMKMLTNKLYQLEYEKNLRTSKDLKRLQIGFGERSDKIRTYNYLQDRVTDHRFSYTSHNVQLMLEGGEYFDEFLSDLRYREVERVLKLLE